MLIVSRHRHEAKNSEVAAQLAAKFNTVVLSVPLLYDLPADSQILQRLRSLKEAAYFLAPISERAQESLLTLLQIPFAETFETADAVQIPEGKVSGGRVEYLTEPSTPRWYPVIDVAQCTACLECVNYCLFGVYAIGSDSRPFVDQPDSCRDGCPACARVCPSNAIMFPLYEDRAIAGYEQVSADDLNDLVDLVDQI
jgi:NAD-dependent dihydropyrimidine dehydrogenase PreA subunit